MVIRLCFVRSGENGSWRLSGPSGLIRSILLHFLFVELSFPICCCGALHCHDMLFETPNATGQDSRSSTKLDRQGCQRPSRRPQISPLAPSLGISTGILKGVEGSLVDNGPRPKKLVFGQWILNNL